MGLFCEVRGLLGVGARAGTTKAVRWVDMRTPGVSSTHPSASQPGVLGGAWWRGGFLLPTHPIAFFLQIRIRDPNQGGKDITEEIMSGARTASTPTPPQVLVCSLSDALAGMTVLPWTPKFLDVFL